MMKWQHLKNCFIIRTHIVVQCTSVIRCGFLLHNRNDPFHPKPLSLSLFQHKCNRTEVHILCIYTFVRVNCRDFFKWGFVISHRTFLSLALVLCT